MATAGMACGRYGYGCTTHGDFAAGTKSIDCTESSEWWKGEAAHSDYTNPPTKLGAKKVETAKCIQPPSSLPAFLHEPTFLKK